MSPFVRNTLTPLTVICVAVGCKARGSNSKVKHEYGKTTRQRDNELSGCTAAGDGLGIHSSPRFKAEDDYLTQIMHYVMKENPETFKGELSPEKFCIMTFDTAKLNAHANPTNGAIVVSSYLLKSVSNDAQVAAVVSHELAHITMNHIEMKHPLVQQNTEWQKMTSDFDLQSKIWGSQEQSLNDNSNAVSNEIDKAEAEWLARSLSSRYGDSIEKIKVDLSLKESEKSKLERQEDLAYRNFIDYLKSSEGQKLSPNEKEGARLKSIADRASVIKQRESLEVEILTLSQNLNLAEDGKTKAVADALAQMPKERQQLLVDLHQKKSEVEARLLEISIERQSARDRIAALERSIVSSDVASNWTEQEADEVGFEFYLRARFHPVHFNWVWEPTANEDLKQCRAKFTSATATDSEGLAFRGSLDHPSGCWRLFDNEVLERAKHKDDYANLLPAADKSVISPGVLVGLPIRNRSK